MAQPLEALERRRAEILAQIQHLGDMRRGSIVEHYVPCGKSPCCCKKPGHPGHGPYFALTRKVEGKTQTRQLRVGPGLQKVRQEVETFHRFRALSEQLLQINEEICERRPRPAEEAVKKTSRRPSGRKSNRKSTAC